MPGGNEYIGQLEARRDAAAGRADRLATGALERWEGLSPEQRDEVLADLRDANRETGALGRQVAWHRRRDGWASPAEPAWSD